MLKKLDDDFIGDDDVFDDDDPPRTKSAVQLSAILESCRNDCKKYCPHGA